MNDPVFPSPALDSLSLGSQLNREEEEEKSQREGRERVDYAPSFSLHYSTVAAAVAAAAAAVAAVAASFRR